MSFLFVELEFAMFCLIICPDKFHSNLIILAVEFIIFHLMKSRVDWLIMVQVCFCIYYLVLFIANLSISAQTVSVSC